MPGQRRWRRRELGCTHQREEEASISGSCFSVNSDLGREFSSFEACTHIQTARNQTYWSSETFSGPRASIRPFRAVAGRVSVCTSMALIDALATVMQGFQKDIGYQMLYLAKGIVTGKGGSLLGDGVFSGFEIPGCTYVSK
jgi:hypothetical protein